MSNLNINKVLNQFAKDVIRQSRANLTRSKKNTSKSLYDSLTYETKASKNSFSFGFFMNNYGLFQDQGVRGVKSGKSLSDYSFKPSSNVVGMEMATGTFARWAKAKGLRYRNEKGQFKTGGLKTLGILIAQSVKNKGIKPSLFFTKPFENHFKRLPDELIEAYALDLDDFFEFSTKQILNNGKN